MILKFIVPFLLILNSTHGAVVQDPIPEKVLTYFDFLPEQLEKYHNLYTTALDERMRKITVLMNTLESSFKALEEKAQVWDIFRHHIESWNDHIKSLDHKIDLIKRTQDENQILESKVSSLEFTVNHILSKVDQLNEKSSEIKQIDQKLDQLNRIAGNCEENEIEDTKEIKFKLSNIMRHVVNIQTQNCRVTRSPTPLMAAPPVGLNTPALLRDIQGKITTLANNQQTEEIKEILAHEKQNTESLEEVMELVRNVDDKTARIISLGEEQEAKLDACTQAVSSDVAALTEKTDIISQQISQIELLIKNNINTALKEHANEPEIDKTDVVKDVEDVDGSVEKLEPSEVTTVPNVIEPTEREELDFIQPRKAGCDALTKLYNEGIYKFAKNDINDIGRDFNERLCLFPTSGSGWTVIQRRGPYEEQESFNRSWADYKNGFGDLSADFWFGNEFIHQLVKDDIYELRIELQDFDDETVWAEYKYFRVDSEDEGYKIFIDGFSGNVHDAMSYHNNQKFSTFDKNNDQTDHPCCPCAPGYGSGWWFNNCSEANLNGIYHDTPNGHDYIGVIWESWHGDYSLKSTRMMVRPRETSADEVIPEDP